MSEALPPSVLCAAGPIAEVRRAGHAPLGEDDPIEIRFASGAIYTIEVGFEGATDIQIFEGTLLDNAFGHLRTEEPETWAGIATGWTHEAVDLPWLIGRTLSNPRRLRMVEPYAVDVGFALDAGGKIVAIFGEADLIFVDELGAGTISSYALEIAGEET